MANITMEEIVKILSEDVQLQDMDNVSKIVILLREKLPYPEVCCIITTANPHCIYFVTAEVACKYLTKEDIRMLHSYGCSYDIEYDYLYTFI